LGGRDQEDHGSRPTWANSFRDPISISNPDIVAHSYHPAMQEAVGRRIIV
jgi:hypothetical protein